jgi:hypothetical protein
VPTLIVKRPKRSFDRVRNYRIIINGEVIGTIANGAELRHPIDPGPHTLQAKIDWCGSPEVRIDAGDTDTTVIVQNRMSALQALIPLFPLWYISFSRGRYLRLELA